MTSYNTIMTGLVDVMMMNEDLTYNEKARLGQAVNLALHELQGTKYTHKEVIDLVFHKYLPLLKIITDEYIQRRESMKDFVVEEVEVKSLDNEIDNLF